MSFPVNFRFIFGEISAKKYFWENFIAPKDSSLNFGGSLLSYFRAIVLISAVISILDDLLPARTGTVKRIIGENVSFGRFRVLTLGQRCVLLAVWMQIMHWNVSIRPILSFAIWVGDKSGQTGGIISLSKKLYFGQLELKSLFSFKKQNLFVQN